MKSKYLTIACASMAAGFLSLHGAIAGAGFSVQGQGSGGQGQQGGTTTASSSQGPITPVSSTQVAGAQFSANHVGTAQPASSGASGSGVFSQPVRQAPQTSAYPYSYVHRNDSGFGTDAHNHHEGDIRLSAGVATPQAVGRAAGFNSSTAPTHQVLSRPVVLDPDPQVSVGNAAFATGNAQNPAAVSRSLVHPGGPAPAINGGGGTSNSALTRANQWRHDLGHPHHHRHFVYLNDSIYLIDQGVYDSPPDFSVSPDLDTYTYEDGYYDTFDSSTVGAVQTRLGNEGYYNGIIDSKMKPDLRAAISKYQQEHGMQATGVIDEPLLRELGLL